MSASGVNGLTCLMVVSNAFLDLHKALDYEYVFDKQDQDACDMCNLEKKRYLNINRTMHGAIEVHALR